MFLIQAINMHSMQGVAHALWDGRPQLLIAKQHAKYNHFEEAVERIDSLLEHRLENASGIYWYIVLPKCVCGFFEWFCIKCLFSVLTKICLYLLFTPFLRFNLS